MNIHEFFDNLSGCAHQYYWYLQQNAIRALRKDAEDGYARRVFCPITAVVYSELGIEESVDKAYGAAIEHLRIPDEEAHHIQVSADFLGGKYRGTLLDCTTRGKTL